MPEVQTDIVAGPATLWWAPEGEAFPAESIAAGTDWGGNWTKVGFTKEPLTMNYEFETEGFEIEQSLAPLRRRKISHLLRFETVLAEYDLNLLSMMFEGVYSSTPAGVGQVGFEELDVGDESKLTPYAWGFEGEYVDEDGDTFPIRVFIYRGTIASSGEQEWAKSGTYVGVPITIEAMSDFTQATRDERLFKVQKVLEPATS